jgi:hypothetical protein
MIRKKGKGKEHSVDPKRSGGPISLDLSLTHSRMHPRRPESSKTPETQISILKVVDGIWVP